jgi:L-alanine-DL-glutamate epimerase-like enolase superfamily enzyme
MKIAKIEAFRIYPKVIKEAWVDNEFVWPSRPPAFLIKVSAENGNYGIGEATSQTWYLGETAPQIEACIALYDQALRGQDAGNFARLHALMEAKISGGMPGGRGARSGVDMACYDLVGKVLGVPVHALLGGAYRTEFAMLTNLYHKTPAAMAEAAGLYARQGFEGLKIKVGDTVLAKGWNRDHLEAELALLRAALDAVPTGVYIDADANQGWRSAQWTVSVLKRFAGHDNLSIEQPVPYADLVGAAFVRAHAGVPVILDESVWSPEALMTIVNLGACDRIVLKLNRLGGFFPAAQAIAICEAANIGVSVDTNPYTIVGDTALCHIAAIARTPYPVDCEGHMSFLDIGTPDPFRGGITIGGAIARLPDAPGLGVDVDWQALAEHRRRHEATGTELA